MDSKKKKGALDRIAEFIDYVKVQHKMKSAKPINKEKVLHFNKKEA
jgi:soluble P-type ATPase